VQGQNSLAVATGANFAPDGRGGPLRLGTDSTGGLVGYAARNADGHR
jgi:hypothetical protein